MHYASRGSIGSLGSKEPQGDEWAQSIINAMMTLEDSIYCNDIDLDEEILYLWGIYNNNSPYKKTEFNPEFFRPYGR